MLISAVAKTKIMEFLATNPNKVFRIGVITGGCNGFTYVTEITDQKEDDILISEKIVTDVQSDKMLENTIIDYVDNISRSGFTFSNPDASDSCGCGISFDY